MPPSDGWARHRLQTVSSLTAYFSGGKQVIPQSSTTPVAAVLLARWFLGEQDLVAGTAAVLGHTMPVWLGFKGLEA